MEKKLQDAELKVMKVMNVIWREQPVRAARVVEVMKQQTG